MNELYRQLENHLNQLVQLLDEEKACLIGLRYEDLLRVVNRKRATQAALEVDLARLKTQSPAPDRADISSKDRMLRLAVQVREKGRYNHRLAQASIQVVDSLRTLLGQCVLSHKGYDRDGSSVRPPTPSVLIESA
jgi:flagellar biosynthesis/type III secretory pathway chaperone